MKPVPRDEVGPMPQLYFALHLICNHPRNYSGQLMTKISPSANSNLMLSTILFLMVIILYSQAVLFDFADYDDVQYITRNPHVAGGLTVDNIFWAFRSLYASNWHPLTWISHMLDVQIFGMNPSGHHFTNILIHASNAVLLFFVLTRMTGARWQSMTVAVLFALHPLHVESVAFVAERKDVLSMLFWMLTMLAYFSYVRYPSILRYSVVMLLYAMGLMAKPMLVSLPFILLLLDFWPLGRWREHDGDVSHTIIFWRLVLEKLPLFGLAAASCIVTVVAQDAGGSLGDLAFSALLSNLENTLVSYAAYLSMMMWPVGLSAFYPLQEHSWWQIGGSALVLASISFVSIHQIHKRPYLIVGWFWYLITLIPVIGIVQVGKQAMADRYTYIPLIGVFVVFAWEAARIPERWRVRQAILTVAFASVLSVLTWRQIGYWKNGITLFSHAVEVTDKNWLAHHNLGVALMNKHRNREALYHLQEALRIKPDYAYAYLNLGKLLGNMGDMKGAVRALNSAINIDPNYADPRQELDKVYEHMKRH